MPRGREFKHDEATRKRIREICAKRAAGDLTQPTNGELAAAYNCSTGTIYRYAYGKSQAGDYAKRNQNNTDQENSR